MVWQRAKRCKEHRHLRGIEDRGLRLGVKAGDVAMLRLAECRRIVERRGLMRGHEGAHCVKRGEVGRDAGAGERGA